MKHSALLIAALATTPALANETRQLDAHEHGVGELNIAIEANNLKMELIAPGADIVGFEYAAKSDADHDLVKQAIETLSSPLALFALPEAAKCSVQGASVELETEGEHEHAHDDHDDDHAHEDDHDDEHHHDEEHGHDDHDHDDEHKEHADHDEHDEHDEDHDHDEHDHAEEAGHSEFHAEYAFTCEAPDALEQINFAYFETFENARELNVQIVTTAGATAYEVTRETPTLELKN